MARLSRITVGLSALMVVLVGATSFLLLRPRHHARPSVPSEPQLAPPSSSVPPAAEIAGATPLPARSLPPPISAPEPVPVVALGASDAGSSDAATQVPRATPERRALLVSNHNRRLQEADERAFATLNLPDTTRAAVRLINEEYRRRTEPDTGGQAGGSGDGEANVGGTRSATGWRQDALTQLLGAERAKEFDIAERGAVLRLRGKYRFQWGRQLRE